MNLLFSKKFLKDIEHIQDKKARKNIEEVINSIKCCGSVSDLTGVRKMTGYENYYRLRIGDYRLGFKLENNTLFFFIFNDRKEIYTVFP